MTSHKCKWFDASLDEGKWDIVFKPMYIGIDELNSLINELEYLMHITPGEIK